MLARKAVRRRRCGYREALRFVEQVSARRRAWAIEASGSYGAGPARFLSEHGEAVLEISRTLRAERRLVGKDDMPDAVRIARAALASEALALPRSGEQREALQLLLMARRSAVDVRREALVQLRSVIVTSPDRLRDELRKLPIGLDPVGRRPDPRRRRHDTADPPPGTGTRQPVPGRPHLVHDPHRRRQPLQPRHGRL